ncbi:MAG: Tetracycline resistance protein, class B [Chlamydiia bacterium]|nr:Tetracycline resistance protein, class B [Chlamydiia bacterium]MCH9615608.1 Tetracycline resistance protein, class B [Chlamydiia bacterium]MCH9628989.1 Tetracycline resistance protein, class B [Chlamydiia bacterium]
MIKGVSIKGIAPALLAIMIDSMGFTLVYPMLTAIFASKAFLPADTAVELRNFYLGLGYLLYPLGMFFGASFLGDLSDLWGRKRVLVISILGLFVSYFLMGFGVSFASLLALLLGRFFSGLMAGSQPIAQAAIVDQSTPETKALNMSFITFALSIGLTVGPLIGSFASEVNLSSPFYVVGFLCLVNVLWLLIGFKETYRESTAGKIDWLRPVTIFIDVAKHPGVSYLCLAFLLMQVGFGIYLPFCSVFLQKYFDYHVFGLGLFMAWVGLIFTLSLVFVTRLLFKRHKVYNLVTIFLFLTAVGLIGSSFASIEWVFWAFAIPIAGGDILAYTTMLTCFSDEAHESKQGWAMGVASAVIAVSWTISGLFANLLPLLGVEGILFVGGLFMLASALMMTRYSVKRRRQQAES